MISFDHETSRCRSRYDLLTPTLKHVKLEINKEDRLKYASFIQALNSDKECISKRDSLRIYENDVFETKRDSFINEHCDTPIYRRSSITRTRNTRNKNEGKKSREAKNDEEEEAEEQIGETRNGAKEQIGAKRGAGEKKTNLKFKTNFLNLEQVKYKELAQIISAKQSEVEKLFKGFENKISDEPTKDTAKQDSTRTKKKEKGKNILNNRGQKKKHDDYDMYNQINENEVVDDEKVKEVNMRRTLIQKIINDQRIQKNATIREEFLSRYHTLNEIEKSEDFQQSLLRYTKSATKQKEKESSLKNRLNELKKVYKKKHLSVDETRRKLVEVQKRNNDLLMATTISCQNTEEQLRQQLRKEEEHIARVLFEKEEKLQTLTKIKMKWNEEKLSMHQQIKHDQKDYPNTVHQVSTRYPPDTTSHQTQLGVC